MNHYPTNLSDSQWMLLEGVLNDKRKRKHSLRDIFNAIFYLLKTGCQWRMFPKCFPNWELVYYYFTKWKNTGVIEQIHEFLRNNSAANRDIDGLLTIPMVFLKFLVSDFPKSSIFRKIVDNQSYLS